MIIKQTKFIKEIDFEFWSKATKNVAFKDVIQYRDISRRPFLMGLCKQINEYEHNFSKPNYYYFPKDSGVLRKVKSYAIPDIVIYYFCVKLLQNQLYERISKNEKVFGGFKFTSSNNSTDNISDSNKGIMYPTTYESFLAKENFALEWKEFQNLAKAAAARKFDKYVHIDISHFYDDINLDILEREIRNIINDESDVIDLLFHFLKYSDKRDLRYSPSNVGIPQEEIGDMSRVLANFYLSSFDTEILKHLSETFSPNEYMYMRYSDDMWFCFNGDDHDAYRLIQQISLSLGKLKLHINEKKLAIYKKSDFVRHWYFNKWKQIEKNWSNYSFIKDMYHNLMKGHKYGRWSSIARYLLKIITSSKRKYLPLYNYNDSKQLIMGLIHYPVLVEKLENNHMLFLAEVLKKHNNLIDILKNYLTSKQNIYPNIEYFILNLLSLVPNKSTTNIVDFLCEYYLNVANTKDYHWYSRTICIKYFMKPSSMRYLTTQKKRNYAKIIDQIRKNAVTENAIERRYLMYFLYRFGKIRGRRILEGFFIRPKDLRFIKYLEMRW